jgi:hypothetical protein
MAPEEDGAIVFIIDTVPEVTIPCRIVVVRVSGEFIIVDESRCRRIDRSRGVDRCGCNIYAARDNRAAEIWPMIDRESNSDVANTSDMTPTGADVYLRIAFCSDEAAGYDCGEDK